MNEKDWQKFFELLEKIVNQHGSWEEHSQEVISQARKHSSSTNLEEFVGWYEGDASEEV